MLSIAIKYSQFLIITNSLENKAKPLTFNLRCVILHLLFGGQANNFAILSKGGGDVYYEK